jgi:hypothetical protein
MEANIFTLSNDNIAITYRLSINGIPPTPVDAQSDLVLNGPRASRLLTTSTGFRDQRRSYRPDRKEQGSKKDPTPEELLT